MSAAEVTPKRDNGTAGNVVGGFGILLLFLGGFLLFIVIIGGWTDDKFDLDHSETFNQSMILGAVIAATGLLMIIFAPKRDCFDLEMQVRRRDEPFRLRRFTEEPEARQQLTRLETARLTPEDRTGTAK